MDIRNRYLMHQLLTMVLNGVNDIVREELTQDDYMKAQISSFLKKTIGLEAIREEASVVICFGGGLLTFIVRDTPLDKGEKVPANVIAIGDASFYESEAFIENPNYAVKLYVADLFAEVIKRFLCQMKEKRGV